MSSPELELAQRKIAELEQQIKTLLGADAKLILLPNGDLHRGLKLEDAKQPNIEAEVIPARMQNPIDRAVAQIMLAAKDQPELTCLWCGLGFQTHSTDNYKDLREHLKKDHGSVFEASEKLTSEMLMANLAEAQERLKAATA
jgi:hypothetical protein